MNRKDFINIALTYGVGNIFYHPFLKLKTKFKPIQEIGLQTYSLKQFKINEVLELLQDLNIKTCELWDGHIQPYDLMWRKGMTKEENDLRILELKNWSKKLDLRSINQLYNRFNAAGIYIHSYNGSFSKSDDDDQIFQVFEIAKQLKTSIITTSAKYDQLLRIKSIVLQNHFLIASHNHSIQKDENYIASGASLIRATEINPNHFKINLDIGHMTAANEDCLSFIRKNHARICSLHLRDRKKDQGPVLSFGKGDTKILEVVELIQNNYPEIAMFIELDYPFDNAYSEIKNSLDYINNRTN
ncbi:sugar phosphate isomerase/epimerase family protein [Sphingobacterium kyonggiense]